MLEVVQSMALIRQAMDRYSRAGGGVGEPIKSTTKLPKGEAYLETEAPKGQMGFMVVGDGTRHALASAGAQQQFLQPVGHGRIVSRMSDRRHSGDSRFVGHRVRGGGSVERLGT